TIDWLVKNVAGNNDRAGLWGISYPGFYSSAGAIDSHPALKAVSPQAPIGDWFWDDFHRHGAFNLSMAFLIFDFLGKPRPQPTANEETPWYDSGNPDGYQFFLDTGPVSSRDKEHFKGDGASLTDITAHPNRGAFWQ